MKKYSLVLAVFIASCSNLQNKQDKAESLVKSYLKQSLNDPGSYEAVSFDSLEVNYEDYSMGDPKGRKLDTLAANFRDTASRNKNLADSELYSSHTNYHKYDNFKKLDTIFRKKADSIEMIAKENGKGYKGRIVSYGIKHTYRAKNGFGALRLTKMDFWIDSTLTKVVNAEAEE